MLLVMATATHAATSPSSRPDMGEAVQQAGVPEASPREDHRVGCKDRDGIVLCAVTLHNTKTGQLKCVGIEPGPKGMLYSSPVNLPPKYCGIKKKFTA